MQRVSLAGLRRTEKDDSSVLSLNKGLHYRLDTSAIKFVLSLPFAEDIVELEDICVAAIRSASLSNRQSRRCQNTRRIAPFLLSNQMKLTKMCPYAMRPSAVQI